MKSLNSSVINKSIDPTALKALHLQSKVSPITRIPETLSEETILDVQNQFMTNGFHYIGMADRQSSRELVMTMLSCLNYYDSVACLTLGQEPLEPHVADIHLELLAWHCIMPTSPSNALQEFFLDTFYYDFMWIEASEKLLQEPWFSRFEECIINLELDKKLPILVFYYDVEKK